MKNPIGDRMKDYENVYRFHLPRRSNVVIRVDGRSFSNFCKKMAQPFDHGFNEDMDSVAIALCEEISGAKLAYVQSDEVSVILNDYATLNTDAWFANNVQKMASVSASIATATFNRNRLKRFLNQTSIMNAGCTAANFSAIEKEISAQFDSRVFVIPELEEVANYIISRTRDAHRNSLSRMARSFYGTKELEGKNTPEMNEMIFQKGQNFNNLPERTKRGALVIKGETGWKAVDIPDVHDYAHWIALLNGVCTKTPE